MRGFACAALLLFGLSAALQWNDPDPLRWIALYAAAAALSLGPLLGRRCFAPALLLAIGYALLLLPLLPELVAARSEAFTSFRMRAASDEAPREAVGLGLCFAWALAVAVWSRRSPAGAPRSL